MPADANGEVRAGDVFQERRTFSIEALAQFSALTHDPNPIHAAGPSSGAGGAGGRGPLVHGALLGSVFPSIIGSRFPGAIYREQTLTFRRPVHADEEVVGEVSVARVAPLRTPGGAGAAPRRHLVTAHTRLHDAAGLLAVDGHAKFIL